MIGEMDSHENESNKLPEEWKIGTVGNLYKFTRKPRDLQINPDQEIPFIPMDYISEDTNRIKGWQMKKFSEISSGTFVFKNDLIVAKITPSFENGKQAVLDNLPEDYGYATTEVWALHPKDDSSVVEHLYNYLIISKVRSDLASRMEGSTGRQRLPRYVLENLEIPVPPLYEQKKIAHVLQTVQEAKEKTEEVIKAAKELKKSLMKHLFTYGPVSVEEAEHVLLKETEIGMVPEEWKIIPLGELLETNLRNGVYKPRSEYGKGETRIIQLNDIYSSDSRIKPEKLDTINLSEKEKELYRILGGDIIINRVSKREEGVGAVAIVKSSNLNVVFESNMFRVHLDQSKILNEYFLVYGQTHRYHEQVMQRATKANQTSINQKNLQTIPIPTPDLKIQAEIIEHASVIDKKIEAEENKKKALEELFNTLLHNLLTAKVRVNHLEIET